MSTPTKITSLHDYPAIKKLASALYRLDAHHHGAAIMIGAGFSRSAAVHVSGKKKVPLWSEFTKNLARDLYADEVSLSFADPLRVAEEYRAYFGQGALNDRIRFDIDNEAWRTGPLYNDLLNLPWSEVLTTNWDTLLERAADGVQGPYYTVVSKTSDLAWAQSPRIVKLHGTIGVTDTFVAAQEDYRTYPERFAPFVNFARQVFIENELCLLGFSGDDPNFLQWAGWVRDHLANHARKIYLIGSLNLSAARRKQLESINIAPVDLYPAVADITDPDIRHAEAIRLFLKEMKNEGDSRIKPHDWKPSILSSQGIVAEEHSRIYQDAEYGASVLTNQLETLRRDREAYPGWLVCPVSLRWQLANQVSAPFPNPKNLAALTNDNRARLLYEISWRCRTAFEYIQPWLAEALFEVAGQDQPCAISEHQQAEIALTLLNNTRWLTPSTDEQKEIVAEHVQALVAILEKHAFYFPDTSAEVAYHQALVARDQFDFDVLTNLVDKVSGEDIAWKLRKASLLLELGRVGEATDLLALAYGQLRENHRKDRQSIPIMSRLVWAHWLMKAVRRGAFKEEDEELPSFVESSYRKWKCDPWSWVDALRSSIDNRREKYLKNQNPIEPQFAQGHYRDRSDDTICTHDFSDFLLLDGLSRICGAPLRINMRGMSISVLADKAKDIVFYGGSGNELLDLSLAIRSASSETSPAIVEIFGRINIACLTQRSVETLVSRILHALPYWQRVLISANKKNIDGLTTLRVFIEVLARLTVQVLPDQAKDIFVLAASLGERPEMQHIWLRTALGSLLDNSLASVPDYKKPDVLEVALKFPLPQEIGNLGGPPWPNPIVEFPGERRPSSVIDERIAELIAAVRVNEGGLKREPLLRLLPLVLKKNFLSEAEHASLADAIWGDAPEYAAVPETGLFPHALLILPTRDLGRVETLLRSRFYEYDQKILEDTKKELHRYPAPEIDIARSTYEVMAGMSGDQARLLPTAKQARVLFDQLTTWRPVVEQRDVTGIAANARKSLATSIGRALSCAIVPALTSKAKSNTRLQQLLSFCSEVDGAQTALPALVYFAAIDLQSARTVGKTMASVLRGRDFTQIYYVAIAIHRWMRLATSRRSNEFKKLKSMVIAIIESGRTTALHQLLWLTRELLTENQLTDEQCTTLAEIVPGIFKAADYKNVNRNGEEAVITSTIRAECVRLANILVQRFPENQELGNLVSDSIKDPLPEVRFALTQVAEV